MLDYNRIANRIKEIHCFMYDHMNEIPDESFLDMCRMIELGDEIMSDTPELMKEIITIRQDFISSDTEVLAYLFALLTYCMDENTMELFIRWSLDIELQ